MVMKKKLVLSIIYIRSKSYMDPVFFILHQLLDDKDKLHTWS